MSAYNTNDDAEEDALDEVYSPEPEYTIAQEPAKTAFQAWHHPRKQYVRIKQWCAETRRLIPDLGLAPGDPFRYLTLPGNELLDIRALHGVCERADVKLRYLGFNSVGRNTPDQAELALSQSEVLGLSHIDSFSLVVEDRLESVANARSPVFARTRQSGPFHAINLDLCDSIAFRAVNARQGSPLAAVAKLLELQLESTQPWLLFITTKAQPDLVNDFARDGFMRAITANADASPEFRQALAELIEGNIDQLDAAIAAAWTGQDARFLRLFCTGLGKWLLSLLCAAAPPRELTLLSSCFYQSGPLGPDMLSLAFRCSTPAQALHDRFEILPAVDIQHVPSEIESALSLTRRVAEIYDLDGKLSADEGLREQLIGQAGKLLATARYQLDAYEIWARGRFEQFVG